MDLATIATVVSACATTIYTVGTFMLWKVTHKSLVNSQNQLKLYESELKKQNQLTEFQLIHHIYRNFRELYSALINNQFNLDTLATARNMQPDDLKRNYIATFLINHAFELHYMNQQDLLQPEMWQRIKLDMGTLFKWTFVKERWEFVKNLYPEAFQNLVNELVEQ